MTRIRKWPLIMAIILTISLLAACSGKSGNSNNSANTSESQATNESTATDSGTTTAEPKEPVKLKMTVWGSPMETKIYENAIKVFEEKHEGRIKVELMAIPADYDTKLTTMIAGNDAPDVAMMESATLAFPLSSEGKLLNLKDYLANDSVINKDSLVPGISYYAEPGNLIGIAPGPEMFALYYNKDMFTEAGLDMPPTKPAESWTWDEFVEVAKKLTIDQNGKNATEAGFDPKNIKQYGVHIPLWWGSWSNFVYSNGGDFLSADGKSFGLDNPEAAEAIQKVADLINVYHVAPSPVQAKNIPANNVALQTKKVAMIIDGQWSNYDLGKSGVNYDIGVLPKMKTPATTVVCGMFSIFASSKHPAESWELLKAMIDPETTLELNKAGLWMPSLKSWYTDDALKAKWVNGSPGHPPGFAEAELEMLLDYAKPSPTGYVKNFNKIMDIVNPALDKVWLGEQKAADALKAIDKQVQPVIEGRRDISQP